MDKTKAVSVLTDLIKINRNKISAYSNAANNNKELALLFEELIKQASEFIKELQCEITSYGLSVPPVSLPVTKVYKTWKEFEIVFSEPNRKELPVLCEYGEAVLETAYNNALEETGIPANAVILILKQRREIKAVQHKIKKLWEAQKLFVETAEL